MALIGMANGIALKLGWVHDGSKLTTVVMCSLWSHYVRLRSVCVGNMGGQDQKHQILCNHALRKQVLLNIP